LKITLFSEIFQKVDRVFFNLKPDYAAGCVHGIQSAEEVRHAGGVWARKRACTLCESRPYLLAGHPLFCNSKSFILKVNAYCLVEEKRVANNSVAVQLLKNIVEIIVFFVVNTEISQCIHSYLNFFGSIGANH
jgi:hypothetical protein